MRIHGSISFFIILTLAGCATKTLPETVYEDKINLVRLEASPQVEPGVSQGDFQHPLELSDEEMSLILGAIRLQKKRGLLGFFKRKKPTSIQAFKPNEIKIMSPPLRLALGKAKPNERVAFLFTQSRGKLLTGITSGVLFVKGDRIHLILGRYKSASRPHEKDITLHDPAIPSPPYTGFQLAAAPPYALLVDVGESPFFREGLGDQQWVMMDYRELFKNPPDAGAFPVLSDSDESKESKGASEELKEKLSVLKQLRDDDLITEEEYDQKRQELLKEY